MNERELEQLARRLGERAAARLDVEATARAVTHRLRTEPVTHGWWRRMPALRAVAAAAVVVLTAAVLVTSQLIRTPVEARPTAALVELRDLTADELEEVFDSLAVDVPVHELTASSLYDLDEGQLEELLALMEG